ncbi:ACT domain-containing protein [Clostridium algoriphilum]|uniref:ACT domain-containing protein n=1 Tax=Clostridium algoriphilum TaxID=198347 RepID=UPI001CF141F9|nr:ACT domain-containing protein [Clostridium algoriphilum]MCB2294748.1 ACT domain-containing protein [Clostridium algoriphilum]
MYKTISAKVEHGIDALVRVTNTLRRKEFKIRGIVMEECEIGGYSDLRITIEEYSNLGIEQAMMQLRKIINVYEIEEFKGNQMKDMAPTLEIVPSVAACE